jgi:hypothetical protein
MEIGILILNTLLWIKNQTEATDSSNFLNGLF